MRYQAYDYYMRGAELVHDGFKLIHDISNHPQNPLSFTWPGRISSAFLETGMRLTRRYEKPDFDIDSVEVNGKSYRVEEEVVESKPFCNLVHFNRLGVKNTQKVLLVAPLSGHHATLLKGTVQALLPDHEVYVTDWLDARLVPMDEGTFSFDRYVTYLIDFLEFLGGDCHLMAICQPTVQALIATAVLSERESPYTPKSLTLMAGPIDTSKNPTRVNEFAHKHPMSWYRGFAIMSVPQGYPGEGRDVYPGFLQLGGFISMNQQTHMQKYASYFQNMLFGEQEDAERFRAFYDEYLAVLDMPAEFYLETIERVFKNNEVGNKTITYKGKLVDFASIKNTPLLTMEGEKDDIVGIGQTEAAQTLCENIPEELRQHYVQEGAGHYGIFSGSKFRNYVRPIITEFIHKYD